MNKNTFIKLHVSENSEVRLYLYPMKMNAGNKKQVLDKLPEVNSAGTMKIKFV